MAQLCNERARLVSNENVGPNLHLAVLEAPQIAAQLQPGQFVHLKIPGMPDHVLRRPFSIYGLDSSRGTLDILYQVVGFGTNHLAELSADDQDGASLEIIGPIGNVWSASRAIAEGKTPRALLIGGGVGAAPLFILAQQLVTAGCPLDVVLGAQTEAALVTRARYAELLGREPFCATDDGTYGRAGFCTSLVEERLVEGLSDGSGAYDYVAVCGPTPLMKIVAGQTAQAGVRCEVSLEKRMACGIGACLSCVADTTAGKKRVCVDGPIFDAQEVIW